jgi:nitroreductase
MNVHEAIRTRKSVRSYEDRPIEEEKLRRVLDAARLAPSASNRQEWRFVVVRDPATRRSVAESTKHSFVEQAPVILVCCAEDQKHIMRCGLPCFPIDASIAIDHITLAAVEEGLGTCWIGGFDAAHVKSVLGIPDGIEVVELLPIGYPTDPSPTEKKRLALEDIIRYDRW